MKLSRIIVSLTVAMSFNIVLGSGCGGLDSIEFNLDTDCHDDNGVTRCAVIGGEGNVIVGYRQRAATAVDREYAEVIDKLNGVLELSLFSEDDEALQAAEGEVWFPEISRASFERAALAPEWVTPDADYLFNETVLAGSAQEGEEPLCPDEIVGADSSELCLVDVVFSDYGPQLEIACIYEDC